MIAGSDINWGGTESIAQWNCKQVTSSRMRGGTANKLHHVECTVGLQTGYISVECAVELQTSYIIVECTVELQTSYIM
jgi:hypothetical protein